MLNTGINRRLALEMRHERSVERYILRGWKYASTLHWDAVHHPSVDS